MVYDEFSDEIKNTYRKMSFDRDQLETDAFYKYFYNLLETGTNYADFSFVRLVKSVDERWVEEIEQTLPHIQRVILNPRKFIEEEREVVNVAIARNISTESVRHLLQHSNLIDEYDASSGKVVPNRLLNVYKEESLNTYENRFICTLVAELQYFVNKRFNILFEESKDELGAYLEVQSQIDNYTENIEYKLQLKIKDKETDRVNEQEEKDIFQRVIEIHRLVNTMVASEFITTMKKFPSVRHPIVKTNAIAKNRDYKRCHALWDFLHTYQEIGVSVNVVRQDPTISREFERDIYESMIREYASLHEYCEGIDRLNLRRQPRKNEIDTKDLRQILEEMVDQAQDMPEASVKKTVLRELNNIMSRRKQEKRRADRAMRKKSKRRGKRDEETD